MDYQHWKRRDETEKEKNKNVTLIYIIHPRSEIPDDISEEVWNEQNVDEEEAIKILFWSALNDLIRIIIGKYYEYPNGQCRNERKGNSMDKFHESSTEE